MHVRFELRGEFGENRDQLGRPAVRGAVYPGDFLHHGADPRQLGVQVDELSRHTLADLVRKPGRLAALLVRGQPV